MSSAWPVAGKPVAELVWQAIVIDSAATTPHALTIAQCLFTDSQLLI